MEIKNNFSLKKYNTFNIDVQAQSFANCQTVADIQQTLQTYGQKPTLIIGAGSNILFTQDISGLVIHPNITGQELVQETDSHIYIKAFCGEDWDDFVSYCVQNNYGGLENLSWIPGKVGAVPIQNIGAYGREAQEVIHRVTALEIASGKVVEFKPQDCQFGYRDSIFKNQYKNKYIILSVTFKLDKKPELVTSYGSIAEQLKNYSQKTIHAVREIIINIRKNKLPNPAKIGNAGSFFKNPIVSRAKFEDLQMRYPTMPFYKIDENSIKIPAGWMIDLCGWKGKDLGHAGVYENQALILVNRGQAQGQEILELSQTIKADVQATFGITLEEEVQVL